ncbi:MAG TPA: hypothetical protein VMU45_13200 [Candidatus Eisenbacteria bacterium]|nr:hypothetical protein [Candidatus Eisenbacteria bacterium]
MRRHLNAKLLTFVLLGMWLEVSASAQKNDWLIVPGQRVGPVTAATTRADLDALFGKENVQERNLDISEGPEVATVVFPGDASASLAVTWDREHVSTIHICYATQTGPCRWRTASGVRIGLPIRELEKLNGKAFKMAGYGFDGQGTVTSWRNGLLEENPAACGRLVVRLTPATDLAGRTMSKSELSSYKQVQGDKEYSSTYVPLLELNPMVSALEFQFSGPGCAGH